MTLAINYASDLQVRSAREDVDQAFFNKRFGAIFNELVKIDERQAVYDAAVNTLVETELNRLNDLLGPAITTIQNASSLGFLWGKSIGTHISLVVGEAEGFSITENAALFTPTPVLLVQDLTDNTNWGLVTLDAGGWTKETGDLATHCIYASKTLSSTQWFVSASAAIFPAMQDLLAQCTTAKDATAASAATVAAQMTTLQSAINAIQTGPVSSVATKTGAVILYEADILTAPGGTTLVADLATKASITYVNSQVAGKQDASAKLNTINDMAWAADRGIYATSTAALSTFVLTPFARTLLDDGTGSEARATIGAAATSDIPSKASSAEVIAGSDDAKFATAAGITAALANYSSKTIPWAAAQAAGFTLGSSFNGQAIPWTSGGAGTITLANDAPAGTECLIVCEGIGQATFAAQSGGTVLSRGSRLKSNGQYSMITAIVRSNSGANAAWRLGGDLTT